MDKTIESKLIGKNIVVFSDGTGQDGGVGFDSNVYKLFKAVTNRTEKQIAFYDRGLGTGWRKLSGSLGGAGFNRNILECYQFIFENFEAGDRIYLIGFSRGAATVCSLSNFIEAFGILPKSRPELIDQAYKIYKIGESDAQTDALADFHSRHHTMWSKVKFLGVWDTVAALGAPIKKLDDLLDLIPLYRHKFHNFDLGHGVENAYQALAVDELRKTFLPSIWNDTQRKGQTIEQVWFPGVHSDIGGGYEETGLSDIPLNWMVKNAVKCGLLLHKNSDILKSTGNCFGTMHDPFTGVSKVLKKKQRFWPQPVTQAQAKKLPDIHPSVAERARDKDKMLINPYDPWILKLLPKSRKKKPA